MNNIKMLKLESKEFPEVLRNIPSPPKQLYVMGESFDKLIKRPRLAIIGSRTPTAYGKDVTHRLAYELAEQGIVIISGLALGVDAIAHKAAIEAGGLGIVVLPSPLSYIVPSTNRGLARDILNLGGAIVSEYPDGIPPMRQNFIARNRLMSGLADAVLITEASEKSGTLHTVKFALDQGRDVLAVPGSINSLASVGANNIIRRGATPITKTSDVLEELGLNNHAIAAKDVKGRNQHEQTVLDLMLDGVANGDKLLELSGLTAIEFSQVLTMLQLGAKIRPLGGNQWGIS